MAGANISGDLENPSENIPRGTLWAVGVSIFTYCLMAIFIGAVASRDGEGGNTKYGLHNDTLIMERISAFGPLVLCGCFCSNIYIGVGIASWCTQSLGKKLHRII
eukprot:UN04789